MTTNDDLKYYLIFKDKEHKLVILEMLTMENVREFTANNNFIEGNYRIIKGVSVATIITTSPE